MGVAEHLPQPLLRYIRNFSSLTATRFCSLPTLQAKPAQHLRTIVLSIFFSIIPIEPQTTIVPKVTKVYWGYIGIMEKMDSTIATKKPTLTAAETPEEGPS